MHNLAMGGSQGRSFEILNSVYKRDPQSVEPLGLYFRAIVSIATELIFKRKRDVDMGLIQLRSVIIY